MSTLTFPQLEKVGRLGNQLWQIASTIGLARRHGMLPLFPADWSYRPYFMVPDRLFAHDLSHGTPATVLEQDLAHMDWRTRIYLQDLRFIAEVEDEIRQYFRPSELARERVAAAVPPALAALVIHVRRGDNLVQGPWYPIPSTEYYLDAVRRHPDNDVVIYGDDYEWNTSVLAPKAGTETEQRVYCIKGVPRPKEHEPDYMSAPILDWIDLFAMRYAGTSSGAYCLSNSTLGWWAAWLSGSKDVQYPAPWYGPMLDVHQGGEGYIDGTLMFPDHWQKRDAR